MATLTLYAVQHFFRKISNLIEVPCATVKHLTEESYDPMAEHDGGRRIGENGKSPIVHGGGELR